MTKENNKILIATGIYPPDIGGPATILPFLRRDFLAAGLEVKVLTYAASDGVKDEIYYVARRGVSGKIKYFWQMLKLSFWAEVIYVTDVYSVGYFAYLLKKIFRCKYIVRFAGDAAWETAVAKGWTSDYIIDFEKKKYNSQIEKLKNRRRRILKSADKVIAVSNFLGELAQLIGVKPERVEVIYNAIDFVPPVANSDKVAKIKNDFLGKKIIVTACRLVPWKGVDGLIEIMPAVAEAASVVLVILGDGPEMEKLRRLAEKVAPAGVVFAGKVPQEEIINYLKAADLFILNTNYEGMSHTIMEAMSVGTPVVTTDVGGNPELIADGQEGFLVSYNNLPELKEQVIKILTNPELSQRLSFAGQEKMKGFRWTNTVAVTVNLLKKI